MWEVKKEIEVAEIQDFNSKNSSLPPPGPVSKPKKNVPGVPFEKGYDPRRMKRGKHRTRSFGKVARDLLQSKEIEMRWKTKDTGREKVLRIRADKDFYHHLVGVLIVEGMRGNLAAIRELMDRTEGRPPQSVNVTGDASPWGEFEDMTADERLEFIEKGVEIIRRHRDKNKGKVINAEFEVEDDDEGKK